MIINYLKEKNRKTVKSMQLKREIADDLRQKCTYTNSRWKEEHTDKNGNK